MLSSISWQQYLAAIAIISASYYLYVILRYYQREVTNLFIAKQSGQLLAPSSTLSSFTVMGQAKQDQSITVVADEELQFAEADIDEDLNEPVAETTAAKPVEFLPQTQLLNETDKLIDAFADVDSKSEFISLLNILLTSYKPYESEINYLQVIEHILNESHGKLPFDLTSNDLPALNE
ncbi:MULTISPECIES: hypothetical protein [Mucilaginibacter]|uniref:Uncharacterized protein n=3 Tax=Mucilaginibacter TaxID=423349 RepID=A0A437MY03_9SPHI|nr:MULTISPECIES: hypothetical protein [Mucilaginibacter]MDT3401090.1 hypothetical protein [Mucilaginibacter terrae]MVN91421.1 hypothetical protein [Mucilaginibacter aquatilis]RVU02555.1 hypothetical protein EOD41_01040 [Mucilaginibacter limnophilus]